MRLPQTTWRSVSGTLRNACLPQRSS